MNPERLVAHDPKATAERLAEMEFRELARFGDGHAGVFWSEAGGPGVTTRVPAGSFFVVPRGCWHRQNMLQRSQEFYLTPGRSLHSNAEDPRR